MILAIASGKGGAGKTTVAASLFSVWDRPCVAVDLDVEAPNLHLFLQPELATSTTVSMRVPVVETSRCTGCGACAELCRFKALAMLGSTVTAFSEMCHGCGGCFVVCPEKALSEGTRELGVLEEGRVQDASGVAQPFLMGRLRVGEAMSPPLMRAAKRRLGALLRAMGPGTGDAILDGPPGVSCPAMQAVLDADAVLLVAEPTPFGAHDFALALEAFLPLGRPIGVVINRAGVGGPGEDPVRTICEAQSIPVLAAIPFERAIAEHYSRGGRVSELSETYAELFRNLRDAIRTRLAAASAGGRHD
ncbi:nucleotide-binding protein [Megalodesulfovibrio paquesii]